MRTSERHCELMPSRWPTEGMISELAEGVEIVDGETGVTTLIDTGMVTGGLVSRPPTFAGVPGKVMMMVAVKVPLGRSAGSAETLSVSPAAGRMPLDGGTVSHGSSGDAQDGNAAPWPGMETGWTTTGLVVMSAVALVPLAA